MTKERSFCGGYMNEDRYVVCSMDVVCIDTGTSAYFKYHEEQSSCLLESVSLILYRIRRK